MAHVVVVANCTYITKMKIISVNSGAGTKLLLLKAAILKFSPLRFRSTTEDQGMLGGGAHGDTWGARGCVKGVLLIFRYRAATITPGSPPSRHV